MKVLRTIIIIISILLLHTFHFSCQPSVTQKTLTRVENIIEQYPDSALNILNSMDITPNLEDELYCRYILLEVQAKDKCYQDISGDTLIFRVNDFFSEQADAKMSTLASFYCGRVLQELGENEKAMFSYLEADTHAKQLDGNYNLKGLVQTNIGYLLYNELLYDQALEHFKEGKEYFRLSHNLKNEVLLSRHIGDSYLLKNNKSTDSAFYYYHKGLNLATLSQDSTIKVNVFLNLSVACREEGKNKEAKEYLNQAINFTKDNQEKADLYFNLAQAFYLENKYDSTTYYLHESLMLSQVGENKYLASSIYQLLSTLHEELGDYRQALTYQSLYGESLENIFEKNENKAVLEIQKKYDYEQIKNKNNELLIQRQYRTLIGLAILLVLISLLFYLYSKVISKRRELLEADQQIEQLSTLALSFDSEKQSFRNILLRHFEILKKSALFGGFLRDDERKDSEKLLKKFNEIVYNQEFLDWDILYQTMNELHSGFLDRLKKLAPHLDETEFRICCLLYTDFSNPEIGIILKLSSSTITHKRSSIRKKIGVSEYGDIVGFLKGIINIG